jgi:hypothetical protein
MADETLAAEVGYAQADTLLFRVSRELVAGVIEGEWSEPVQFRFEQDEFGRWNLIMRKVEQ